MKNIVVNDEYRQSDLKPSSLLGEYIDLLGRDVLKDLSQGQLLASVCPACGSAKSTRLFEKFSLIYNACDDCQSFYVSPRPTDAEIARFYRQAPSKIFWRNQLSEASQSQRKAKIIKPRFEWITDSVAEYLPGARHWVDIHTGQQRYLQAMASTPFTKKTVIYPYCDQASCVGGITLIDKPWWEAKLDSQADVISLFEVLDHASDVKGLFTRLGLMLKPGGLCFMTDILASGFDVKELGGNAKNIYPPDRLNIFSVQGLKKLINRHGFECLEFSTPGILDVDIVRCALQEDPSLKLSPFVGELVLSSKPEVRFAFQEFLQRNLLSSYGRILMRKL